MDPHWFTLTDPEGNELCLFQPESPANREGEDQQNLTENEPLR